MTFFIQQLCRHAIFVFATAFVFVSSASAGPVILGGDDLTDHGSVIFSIITLPRTGNTVAETESNDTPGTADPFAIGNDYTGTISSANDSDFVSFSGTMGQTIVATTVLGTLSDSLSDSTLRLVNSDGVSELASNDDFSGSFASQIVLTLPSTGIFFLQVQGFQGTVPETGTYTLELRESVGTTPTLMDGWLYIQKSLENLALSVTRAGNDGSVAVLGSADSTVTTGPEGDAGAAYHFAVPNAAATTSLSGTVTFHEGAAAINQFFTDLGNGTVNPAIIVTAGTDANNDLDSSEGTALTSNATAIANFVNSGGGVLSHGIGNATAYGWLTALIPGASFPFGCDSVTLSLTMLGELAFPGLTNTNIRSGPCHNHFLNHGLPVLARDAVGTVGREAIIGGGNITLPGQITLTPAVDFNPPGEIHTVTANVVDTAGTPLEGESISFDVRSGPNIGDSGNDTTDANGDASFSYTDGNNTGLDEIEASFVDGTGNTVVNTARKYWDLDCQPNNIPDSCDISCAAFNNACAADFPGCGTSTDANNNSVPDECNTSPPGAVCADQTVNTTPVGQCSAPASIDAGSFDPDGDAFTLTQVPPGPFDLGDTLGVALTVDDGNLTDSCSANVTVLDSELPSIICPTVPVQECTGPETPVTFENPIVADNCSVSGSSCTPVSGSVFSLGSTLGSCSVADGSGNANSCSFEVTVVDSTLPDVTAALVPAGKVKDDEGRFRVEFSCSDTCGDVTTTAKLNRIPVKNGQAVELKVDDDREVEFDDGILELEAPSFSLDVFCTDASGNTGTATAMPVFATDDDDKDKDKDKRKRKGKRKHKGERKHKDKDKDKDDDD